MPSAADAPARPPYDVQDERRDITDVYKLLPEPEPPADLLERLLAGLDSGTWARIKAQQPPRR